MRASRVPPHKRSKITLLNSWKTDDSLPVSTLVTPDINHDSYNSRVQFSSTILKYSKDRVHYTVHQVSTRKHHRTAGLKSAEILR